MSKLTVRILKKACCLPIFATFFLGLGGCANRVNLDTDGHPQVAKVQLALNKYQTLSRQPWQPVAIATPLKKKSSDANLPELKKRLALLGDWPEQCPKDLSVEYTRCFEKALKHFQARQGIEADGVLGSKTLSYLNQHPSEKAAILQQSLQNWLKQPKKEAPPYLLVNIPAFELQAIESGKAALSMRVIVGKKTWPTPTLASELKTVVINPGWNVPTNITEKEIIHEVIKDPNYLDEHQLKIVESWQPNAEEIQEPSIGRSMQGRKTSPTVLFKNQGKTVRLAS